MKTPQPPCQPQPNLLHLATNPMACSAAEYSALYQMALCHHILIIAQHIAVSVSDSRLSGLKNVET